MRKLIPLGVIMVMSLAACGRAQFRPADATYDPEVCCQVGGSVVNSTRSACERDHGDERPLIQCAPH